MAIAWTLVALLSAATFSTIGLLATALFRLTDRIDALGRDLRAEIHEGDAGLRAEIRALGDRLTAAGA